MREGFKKNHINNASQIMSFFMRAIWARAAAFAKTKPLYVVPTGHHHNGRLPKGFNKHAPAGTKTARLAASQAIGKRGRVALVD